MDTYLKLLTIKSNKDKIKYPYKTKDEIIFTKKQIDAYYLEDYKNK